MQHDSFFRASSFQPCDQRARRGDVAVVVAQSASAAGPTREELDGAATGVDSWLMTNKSYDGHRYVALDQINKDNVGTLNEVCTFDSDIGAPAQATPLLYQGRLYLWADNNRYRCTKLQTDMAT